MSIQSIIQERVNQMNKNFERRFGPDMYKRFCDVYKDLNIADRLNKQGNFIEHLTDKQMNDILK